MLHPCGSVNPQQVKSITKNAPHEVTHAKAASFDLIIIGLEYGALLVKGTIRIGQLVQIRTQSMRLKRATNISNNTAIAQEQ